MKLRSTKSAKGASSPLSKQKVSQEARSPFRPVNLKDRVAPQPRDIPSTPTRKKIKVQDDSTPSKPFTGSPNTPNGPKTPRTPSSVLQGAKSAFRRCSTPAKLVGRELERKFLTDFVCKHLELCQGGSLYVSGLPGTGKTALLNEILLEMTERLKNAKALVIQVNCMNVSDPKHIFSKISSQLKLGSDDVLQDIFAPESASKSTPLYFVILDEIDHLISKDQDVLYKLFEWAKAPQSRLILVGIANALDLTSRFLPRLETKNEFVPYNVKEITSIIKARLFSLDDDTPDSPTKPKSIYLDQNKGAMLPLMHPMAVELAARKIAGQAIEMVESEYSAAEKITGISKGNRAIDESNPAPKVTVQHVLAATAAMLGSPTILRIRELQMQARLVLCTIVVMAKAKMIREAYFAICKFRSQVASVQNTELDDIVTLLESQGLVAIKLKKTKDNHKNKFIELNVCIEDVEKAVSVSPILMGVLEQGQEALRRMRQKV